MRSDGPSEDKGQKIIDPQDQEGKRDPGRDPGRLSVVGLGPGDPGYLAPRAREVLEGAEVIVGYRTYLDLIDAALLDGKKTVATGMMGEIRRCETAIEQALLGKETAVVSSGDPGIYGMAGLVLELLEERGLLEQVPVEIVPGIPALAAASALLGGPLMHDFAVISLSDLMTPWEMIEKRVNAAAATDFVLVLYNPRSRKRDWQLGRVMEVIRRYRHERTPVGIVKNAYRTGQTVTVSALSRVDESSVDMLSILVVGNSHTRLVGDRMITPRGYREKYGDRDPDQAG